MQIQSIGIDLGKTTFDLVELGAVGRVLVKKKFAKATAESDEKIVFAVEQVAKERNVSMAQISLAWLRRTPSSRFPSSVP